MTTNRTVAEKQERAFLETKTAEKLVESVTFWRDGFIRSPEELRRNNLHGYTDETLRTLLRAADAGHDYHLVRLITEEIIEDCLLIEPELNQTPGISDRKILAGLRRYRHLAPHEDSERRLTQITAIRRAVHRGLQLQYTAVDTIKVRETPNEICISDERISDLITTHEDPEAVADLIVSRDISSADELMAILEAMDRVSPAMIDGVL
jgi:hypothetical protein